MRLARRLRFVQPLNPLAAVLDPPEQADFNQ